MLDMDDKPVTLRRKPDGAVRHGRDRYPVNLFGVHRDGIEGRRKWPPVPRATTNFQPVMRTRFQRCRIGRPDRAQLGLIAPSQH